MISDTLQQSVVGDNEIHHKNKMKKDNVCDIEKVKEFVYVVGEKFKLGTVYLCEKDYLWWSR